MQLPHHDVAIIGSGFAGLGMAIELSRAGRDDLVVLERADQLGGTWRANHYPGCACDVPTPYYSYSFAPKPDWSRFYAPHDEIRAYLEDCADRFGVRPRLRLRTDVTGARWDDAAQRWELEVNGEPGMTARILVAAPGGLSRPAFPDLEGLGEFAGPWFHSAEWDHSVDLRDARVAVIGTGASAIQFVPRIARDAGHVEVFQRTPPWVLPKPDRRISRMEQELYRRIPLAQRAMRGLVWAMQEYQGLANTHYPLLGRPLEMVGRRWIRRWISDPELVERLTPDYRIGCKRILLANDWYHTLAKPHVDVVSARIERVSAEGIVTSDGAVHRADAIVFGTGFKATDPLGALEVAGRDGLLLGEAWRDGMAAHRGTTIAGFPNLFLIPGPNTGTGHASQVYMIESQIRYVLAALARMDDNGAAVIEATHEAQEEFNARLQERMRDTVWLQGGCTSWYLDANGRNSTLWPASSLSFRRALGRLEDGEYRFEPIAAPAPATVRSAA
jgi:cation diffusion facilitator CzcD-associated flavoprotein CzcO